MNNIMETGLPLIASHAQTAETPPVRRWREVLLLLLGGAIIGIGYWIVWQAYLPAWREFGLTSFMHFVLPAALMLAGWLVVSAALTIRRCRETLLLPIVAMLTGLGLLFLLRLAGGAEMADLLRRSHSLGTLFYSDYQKQLFSFAVGWALLLFVLLGWRDYRALSRMKYVVALTAIALLLVTTIFGQDTAGQTLALHIGPLAFQPHDPVKLFLVIFMAAYLVDKRELISNAAGRHGLFTLMDIRYLGPLLVLWLLVMAIVFKHKDLGAAVLLFGSFLAILYLGTGRKNYVIVGLLLFLVGVSVAYLNFERVQTRVAMWQNPWSDADGKGYQIIQSLMAIGNGRLVGAGLAGGYPEQIPAIETDLIYVAISEDLGLLGGVVVIALFLVLIGRMFHVALQAEDPFGQLLAAGLAATLAVQSWVILAGVTKLIPLTGITLPFMSYGGTSMVMNLLLFGLVCKVAERR